MPPNFLIIVNGPYVIMKPMIVVIFGLLSPHQNIFWLLLINIVEVVLPLESEKKKDGFYHYQLGFI